MSQHDENFHINIANSGRNTQTQKLLQLKYKMEKSVQERIDEFLAEKNFFTDGLALIEVKTGINKKYLLYVLVALVFVYLVHGFAPGLFSALIGFLYPAYSSIKAIESETKGDDTKWLTYWVVFTFFHLAEYFVDIFLNWFPLYFLFKTLFLCWCMAPVSWNGSRFLYMNFIRPFFLQHEGEFEKFIKDGTGLAKGLINKVETEGTKAAAQQILHTNKQ